MSECFSTRFIQNNKILGNNDFKDELIRGGVSLYEVIRIINEKPLFYKDHFERLEQSAHLAKLSLEFTSGDLRAKIYQLCNVNHIKNGNIKVVVNYNAEEKTLLVYFIKHKYPTTEDYRNGIPVMLYMAERRNPNAKIIDDKLRSGINSFIKEKKIYEALLVNQSGNITEGSRSNFFAIKESAVFTSPVSEVLPGITRKYVIEACKNLGLMMEEQSVQVQSLKHYGSLFISGTSPKVLPISAVDNISFNTDSIILRRIMKEFDRLMKVNIEEEEK